MSQKSKHTVCTSGSDEQNPGLHVYLGVGEEVSQVGPLEFVTSLDSVPPTFFNDCLNVKISFLFSVEPA